MKSGISRRQGGHQVAQKLMTRTLPLLNARLRVFPSEVLDGKIGGGDGLGVLLGRGAGRGAGGDRKGYQQNRSGGDKLVHRALLVGENLTKTI